MASQHLLPRNTDAEIAGKLQDWLVILSLLTTQIYALASFLLLKRERNSAFVFSK